MFNADFWHKALLAAPVILFSLTFHEFSHAYLAYRFGDHTAKDMGRLTFNPLAHLDLMGTLVMVFSGFQFGWAKPVPVNLFNVRNPRVADFWISAAGPGSNILLAVISGILYHLALPFGSSFNPAVFTILHYGVLINLTLAVFNLIPLFPLDGSHILKSLLPDEFEYKLSRFDQFAPIVLILLVVTGAVGYILWPIVIPLYNMII